MAAFNKEAISFVAIDLETATSARSSICQIGITEVINGELQTPKSWLVQPEGNDYDSMNIFIYGKTICFTGKTQYAVRRVLLQMVKNIGGIPTDSVTSETDVLVVGQQDYRIVGADGMSSKQKKALKLLEKGQLIEILSESEFISRI